jgi:hypothetical protein
MKAIDIITVVVTFLGVMGSLYLALVSGDYLIPIVFGVAAPAIVIVVNVLSRNKIFTTSFMVALIAGAVIVGVAMLVRWYERRSLDAAFDKIVKEYEDYSKRPDYPPLPMRVREQVHYSNHLSAFSLNRLTLAFLAAPAGAGKTVLFEQMVGDSYRETHHGTVYLQLSKVKEKPLESRQPSAFGTQQGLGKVPTIDASNSDGTGLLTVVCSSQFRIVSEKIAKKWPFSLRTSDANRRRFAEVCKDRLEREITKDTGLRIFIDDLDEIEEASLLNLMMLVQREKEIRASSPHGKLLIVLSGRAEVFFTASRERRWFWAESPEPGLSLFTGSIERMTREMDSKSFKLYLEKCVNYELHEEIDSTRVSVLAKIDSQAQEKNSENLREALWYLDGCSFAARHILNLEKKKFDEVVFGRDFYQFWRNRAYEKHRLTTAEHAGEYTQKLKAAAEILADGAGTATLYPDLYVLLYSGLVEIVPVDFGSKLYQVRFQFPQFQSAILSPPWQQQRRVLTRTPQGK